MYISTDAIILKNIPYKESSVISRLFTYEHGKISVIFKGAKKGKNNISAIIEPSNIVHITYYNGKSNLKNVKEVNLKTTFPNTRKFLDNYYYMMAIVALLDKVCEENHKEESLFILLITIFNNINNQDARVDIIFLYFLFQFNKTLGLQVDLLTIDNSMHNYIKILNQNNQDISKIEEFLIKNIDLLKNIKMIIYKHMKDCLIDLNDIHAIKILRNYGIPSRSN
tara:strand:- start:311 stop:982 length:672 start_codon:yes stop_codon:yes gene_type:complete